MNSFPFPLSMGAWEHHQSTSTRHTARRTADAAIYPALDVDKAKDVFVDKCRPAGFYIPAPLRRGCTRSSTEYAEYLSSLYIFVKKVALILGSLA